MPEGPNGSSHPNPYFINGEIETQREKVTFPTPPILGQNPGLLSLSLIHFNKYILSVCYVQALVHSNGRSKTMKLIAELINWSFKYPWDCCYWEKYSVLGKHEWWPALGLAALNPSCHLSLHCMFMVPWDKPSACLDCFWQGFIYDDRSFWPKHYTTWAGKGLFSCLWIS